MISKPAAYLCAFTLFICAVITTVILVIAVNRNDVPLMNIGVFMISLIPLSLFISSIAMLVSTHSRK